MSDKKLYQVQGSNSVRAGGKSYRGGTADDIVALGRADAERLVAQGIIRPVDSKAGRGSAPSAPDPAPSAPHDGTQAQDAGSANSDAAVDSWAEGILAGNVGEVVEAIKGLAADALQLLASTESAGKARKGVLEAIEAELASGQE